MWYTIKLNIDNAAFCDEPKPEIARILYVLSQTINGGGATDRKLYDINGNEVGEAKITED